MSLILSAWTVIAFLLFLGIVVWAWHGSNRADFESAASIPLNDDEDDGHA